jgi:hypothetical protein
MTTPAEAAIEAEVTRGLTMVAIEMILTLGQQLGKGFDLRAYAATIAAGSGDTAEQQQVSERIASILTGISDALGQAEPRREPVHATAGHA